jgi:hypothetical protein
MIMSKTRVLFLAILCLSLLVGMATQNSGAREPSELSPQALDDHSIYFPEPFDFHYPDEQYHDNISDRIRLQATLGEYESGTFVVHSTVPALNVILRATDLEGPNRIVIPASNIDVGIVTFMSRARNDVYLNNIWVGGVPAGEGLDAPYNGFNQDAKDRLPLLPVCIVKNDAEFEAAKANALGHIILTHHEEAKTFFNAGESKQFWITVYIPENLNLPSIRNVFSGDLNLIIDGETLEVPIDVEVINFRLDELEDHNKYMGLMRVWDVGQDFMDTAMADIRAHGANAIRAPLNSTAEYSYVGDYNFDLAITTDNTWTADDVQDIWASGFQPLMYGVDEPGKPPDSEATILEHIRLTQQIHAVGGLAGTAGRYDVLEEIVVNRGVSQDWWLMGTSTRSWNTSLWLTDLTGVRAHIEDLRQDPANKITLLMEGSYEGTMNGHYPLLTRIMYGFWLYNSNFDMGIHWGYASNALLINPYTNTDAFIVAFPAVIINHNGDFLYRKMISSYTWEAYRAGIDDLRYALTINRRINELNDDALREQLRSEFDDILSTFRLIDVNNGHEIRIDAYNGYTGTRNARMRLTDLLVVTLAEEPIPPVADFSAAPTTGVAPLEVFFDNQSTGNVIGWSWDFDNDDIEDSKQKSPKYSFSDPGVYSVRLVAYGSDTIDSIIRDDYIMVLNNTDSDGTSRDKGSGSNGGGCFITSAAN